MKKSKFRLVVDYSGFDAKLDRDIEKVVGRKIAGSGFGFVNERRDICFIFAEKSAAENAMKKVRKNIKRRIACKIYTDKD